MNTSAQRTWQVGLWVCGVAAALVLAVASVRAQEAGAPAPAEAVNPDLVTIDVQDGSIAQLMNAFSRQTGRSVVVGPDVQGTATVRLNQVPWQEALDLILKPHGYGYEVVNNTIVVRKAAATAAPPAEPLISRVFRLKYLDANDIRELIKSQLSPSGQVSALTLRGLRGWEFGSDRSSYRSGSSGGSGETLGRRRRTPVPSDDLRSKVLVVLDTAAVIARVTAIIEEIDQAPLQVLIEAKFVEVNLDKLRDYGVEWGTGEDGATALGVTTNGGNSYNYGFQQSAVRVTPGNFDPLSDGLSATNPFNAGMTMMFKKIAGEEFQVMVHAMEEAGDFNLLSAPSVLAMNNQEATIVVGTKFPIIQSDVTGESAVTSTTLEYYENIGIQLNVIPQVCDGDYITLIVHPAVSDQIGSVAARTGANVEENIPLTEYPVLATREAETQIMIRSGQTVVIGGLLTDRRTQLELKVPWLGDIPVLGHLFKRTTIDDKKLDLLIFLTATLVSPDEGVVRARAGAVRVERYEDVFTEEAAGARAPAAAP